jgi:hypothetical protein
VDLRAGLDELEKRKFFEAAIKALGKYQMTSKLVWDCHQFLIQLASRNQSSTDMGVRS